MTNAKEHLVTLTAKVMPEQKDRLVRYAGRRTAELGRVVSVSELVPQALDQFLPESS